MSVGTECRSKHRTRSHAMPVYGAPLANQVLNAPEQPLSVRAGIARRANTGSPFPSTPNKPRNPHSPWSRKEPASPEGETPPESPKPVKPLKKKRKKAAESPAPLTIPPSLVCGHCSRHHRQRRFMWSAVGYCLRTPMGPLQPVNRKPAYRSPNPSTVYPHEFPSADPASWKVTAEAADPSPPGLRSVIPCPVITNGTPILTLAFADPKAATAAVVLGQKDRNGLPWWQVSLTEPGTTKVVNLTDPDREPDPPTEPGQIALSPSGDQLATAFNGRFPRQTHRSCDLGP